MLKIREDSMSRTNIHRPGGSRRAFFGRVATVGALAGGGFLRPTPARADDDDESRPNPISGGVAPFAPFAIFVHHNPLNPAVPLANINDPSQITDFNGFVGLTHIRGGGTGTDTTTGASMPLAFQADMGFSQGEFIGTDGKHHEATFGFV
jgi:hypothetical protein